MIDREALDSRCGDADGCLLTLGLGGLYAPGAPLGVPFKAMFIRGPCILQMDPDSGNWALSGSCAAVGLPSYPTNETVSSRDRAGEPLWGWGGLAPAQSGGGGPARGGAQVLIDLAGACFLAEGPPDRRASPGEHRGIEPDATRDLYLVAGAPGWDALGPFPADWIPQGHAVDCWLTLRD